MEYINYFFQICFNFSLSACLATMQEINNVMTVTSAKDKIQVGGFRIDKEAEKVIMHSVWSLRNRACGGGIGVMTAIWH